MSAIRRMSPTDLFSLNLTNLDPLTENYDLGFYLNYLMRWPSLFSVVQDRDEGIVGYREFPPPFLCPPSPPHCYLPHHTRNPTRYSKKKKTNRRGKNSNGKTRRTAPLNAPLRTLHAMARPHHGANGSAVMATTRPRTTPYRTARTRLGRE